MKSVKSILLFGLLAIPFSSKAAGGFCFDLFGNRGPKIQLVSGKKIYGQGFDYSEVGTLVRGRALYKRVQIVYKPLLLQERRFESPDGGTEVYTFLTPELDSSGSPAKPRQATGYLLRANDNFAEIFSRDGTVKRFYGDIQSARILSEDLILDNPKYSHLSGWTKAELYGDLYLNQGIDLYKKQVAIARITDSTPEAWQNKLEVVTGTVVQAPRYSPEGPHFWIIAVTDPNTLVSREIKITGNILEMRVSP